jgi:hypothetical protein
MIVVRDVFEISEDRMSAAEPFIRELDAAGIRAGLGPARVMRDRTNTHFARASNESRLVVEREFSSLDAFSERTAAARENEHWMTAWVACKPFVRRAWREVLDTVE